MTGERMSGPGRSPILQRGNPQHPARADFSSPKETWAPEEGMPEGLGGMSLPGVGAEGCWFWETPVNSELVLWMALGLSLAPAASPLQL